MPAARNAQVPLVWWGGTKSSKWIFVSRIANSPALTSRRNPRRRPGWRRARDWSATAIAVDYEPSTPGAVPTVGPFAEAPVRVEVNDGVELEVEVRGSGPALVCVHGFGGAKEDFADHVDRLAARATVVTLDLRGHGDSGGPDHLAAYSLDGLADDVLAVADALALDRFRLLGHSMGGMVVRRVALAAPDRVEAVVFMSTAAGPPQGLDPDLVDMGALLAMEDFAALKAILDEARVLGTPAYERLLAERPGFREFGDWKWSRLTPAMWAALGSPGRP